MGLPYMNIKRVVSNICKRIAQGRWQVLGSTVACIIQSQNF